MYRVWNFLTNYSLLLIIGALFCALDLGQHQPCIPIMNSWIS